MADGVFLKTAIYPDSTIERPNVQDIVPALLEAEPPHKEGSFTSGQPITIRSLNSSGVTQKSFADEWFNRLHALPQIVEFGAVAGGAQATVTLWNAYLSATSLSTIGVTNPDGLQLSGPTLPLTLQPLAYVRHTVHASSGGPETIDSVLTYNTNRADNPHIKITGTRAHLWPFRPNWKDEVDITLSFRTDIFTTRSGKEQRRAMMVSPRKTLEFTTLAHRGGLQAFNRAMAKWQNQPILMPDPTRQTKVAAVAGNTYTVTTIPEWLAEGDTVALELADEVTVATVNTIGADGDVTFVTPPPFIPTVFRPVLRGLLSQTLSSAYRSDNTAEVSVSFSVDPGSEPIIDLGPDWHIHNGREVLQRRFNWADQIKVDHQWSVDQVDFGIGRIVTGRPIDFGTTVRRANFVCQGSDDIAALEGFFHRVRGQQGEFYVPSGSDDLPLAQPIAAGTQNFVVIGTETYNAYNEDTVHKAVAIILRSGQTVYRSVLGMFIEDGNTVLQCDNDFVSDIPVENVLRISWMTVNRLASDQFTQAFTTDGVAQTQLAMQSLQALPVEDPTFIYDGAAQWVFENWGEEGIEVMDRLQYVVNIAYPAIFYYAIPWCNWESTDYSRSGLDRIVNTLYPQATI